MGDKGVVILTNEHRGGGEGSTLLADENVRGS